MKRILLFIVCLITLSTFKVQAAPSFSAVNSDGVTLYYNITDAVNHTVEVTNYYGGEGSTWYGGSITPGSYIRYTNTVINIPQTVTNAGDSYTVNAIGTNAFLYGEMTTCTLPNTIKTIGENSFSTCQNLTSINLPEGLISMGIGAFYETNALISITLPSTLRSAGAQAFEHSAIKHIYNLENTKLETLPSHFLGMGSPVEDDVLLPPTLKKMEGFCFLQSRFTHITIPQSVETIEYYALGQIPSLKTVVLERAVPPVGSGTFSVLPDLHVYVPIDATYAYETAPEWSNYVGKYIEQVKIGAQGYITFYLGSENFEVPAGCTAYIVTGITKGADKDDAVVKAFGAGKIIPKKTGFILQGPANTTVTYQANVSGTEENVAGNLLVGTATGEEFSSTGKRYYVLANGDQGMGFYRQGTRQGMSIKLPAHRAGLCLDESIARAKGFVVDFDAAREAAETTSISSVRPEVQKKNDAIYDLQGRRIAHPTHGIYIVNGKKIVK